MRSIRGLLLWGTFITLIVVLGGSGWLGFKAGRDEAEELFDARLATSARVLDILVARQIEIATVDDLIVIDIPRRSRIRSPTPTNRRRSATTTRRASHSRCGTAANRLPVPSW